MILLVWLVVLPFTQEVLEYDAYFGPIKAGYIRLEYEKMGDTLRICEIQQTTGIVSWFYKVADMYEVLTDTSFRVMYYEDSVHEGNYRRRTRVRFIPVSESLLAIYDGDTVKVPQHVHTVISLIYFLRTLDLGDDTTIRVLVHSNKKTIDVPVDIRKVGDVWEVAPHTEELKIFAKEGMRIYYDRDMIPFLLKVRFFFGYLEAQLKSRVVK